MKTIKPIALFAAFFYLAACGQTLKHKTQTAVQDDWKLFADSNYSINYPENWELKTYGPIGIRFALLSPLSSKQDQFKENINLIIQDLPGSPIKLDKYVEITEHQIKTLVTDGVLKESKRVEAEPIDYHKIVYTGRQGIYKLKFEQYFWLLEDKAYILSFTAEESQYDQYQLTGERMLNSFKLK